MAAKLLLGELCTFNFNCPWMLSRDFNSVTSQNGKSGGNPININEVTDYKTMISNLGLAGSDFSGKNSPGAASGLEMHVSLKD